MDLRARPYRSVLYIPGSRDRALEKARDLAVDAIIFDLEDAVTAEEKPNARALLAQVLAQGGYGARAQIVRINGMDTPWGADDLVAMAAIGPEAILLTKVGSAADVAAVAAKLDAIPAAPAGPGLGLSRRSDGFSTGGVAFSPALPTAL